jgi:KaiC/GvpD/RAD55 family RecA-like ATPase
MTDGRPRSTGAETLDRMLDGGYPADRATLLTGGPGTGKSTLSMQFLQAGLDAGEDCLFVSTEQTAGELRDSFADFDFELDHDRLDFASVHAAPGRTFETDDNVLTLQQLQDDADDPATFGGFDDGFDTPFTADYIQEYLSRFGHQDRIVFDSVSGLSAVSETAEAFRRSVLDLIRFLTDELGATVLLTAEAADSGPGESQADGPATHLLRFTTHGVIELERRPINGDPHRFLTIRKMRGVDFDRRTVEVEFVDAGLRTAPARRSQPPALKDHRHRSVGIDGLDALTGGGLVRGAGVLLTHDGRANLSALLSTLLDHALSADESVTLLPTNDLREARTRRLLDSHGWDLDDLLADGRLTVVDLIGAWDDDQPNVHRPTPSAEAVTERLVGVGTDGDRFTLVSADPLVHTLGETDARQVRYRTEAELTGGSSGLVHVVNPNVIGDGIVEFYRDVAEQVLETWMPSDGLQYVSLQKSPCGFVGTTSLVEYTDEPPYLRVQDPPMSRENPMAED